MKRLNAPSPLISNGTSVVQDIAAYLDHWVCQIPINVFVSASLR